MNIISVAIILLSLFIAYYDYYYYYTYFHLLSIQDEDKKTVQGLLESNGLGVLDLSQNELAKSHVRYICKYEDKWLNVSYLYGCVLLLFLITYTISCLILFIFSIFFTL